MTYLQLVNRARQEGGISGADLVSLANLTGESRRVKNWVQEAWLEVQALNQQWLFLNVEFQFDTVPGTFKYPFGTSSGQNGVVASEHREWIHSQFRIFRDTVDFSDEMHLPYMPFPVFRDIYRYGAQRDARTRPVNISVDPDKSLLLGQVPDDVYRVAGRRWRTPQMLVADTDSPICPEMYHLVVVGGALMKYGTYESAPEVYDRGKAMYQFWLDQLSITQLPEINFGEPLA